MPQKRPISTKQARHVFLWSRRALIAFACLAAGWAVYLQQTIVVKQREAITAIEQASATAPRTGSDDAGGGPDETGTPYEESGSSAAAASMQPQTPEEKQRLELVGQWEDDYRGKRYLTLKEDGTATMIVEPAGIGKTLFAPKLIFDAEWRIEEGRLHLWTKGGEPKGKVRMVLKMFGDRAEQDILELTADRLRLRDTDGKTEYEWRRIMAVADASE